MGEQTHFEFLNFDGALFFTVVLLPNAVGKFPTVICRTPYVSHTLDKTEKEIVSDCLKNYGDWLARGYAVVFQHCRGQGKSTGAFVPYVHEREDGLFLRAWIREQPFYNGELFLFGGSYTASLHYATAPFEADIKGAVFDVQDSERYRLWYRNGQMRKGHANWHFWLYKSKCGLKKSFDMRAFAQLPLSGLSERVLGDCAEDFEQMLAAQRPEDAFWKTRFGGIDAKDAATHANVPILLTTGYHDFYVGGVFDMWRKLDEGTREKSALLVSPYNHGDGYHPQNGIAFPNGKRTEAFGVTYPIDWFDHIRFGAPLPYQTGCVTYYRTFENKWASDFETNDKKERVIPLGEGKRSFLYDPLNPPAFSEEGMIERTQTLRPDVIYLETLPFDAETFVKGRMRAKLTVASDCEDTSFFVRISILKADGKYPLRHDITSLCYQLGDYKKGEEVSLSFTFDEYAFLIQKGERLTIEIAGTDDNSYVSHTNKRGAYHLHTSAKTAKNEVVLEKSYLLLPVEESR